MPRMPRLEGVSEARCRLRYSSDGGRKEVSVATYSNTACVVVLADNPYAVDLAHSGRSEGDS